MNNLLLFVFVSVAWGVLAHGYQKCNKNDPKLQTCLREMVKGMKGDLIAGRGDLPAIDPFKLNFFETIIEDTKFTARNIVVEGARYIDIEKLKLQIKDDYHLNVTLRVPVLKMSAEYSLEYNVTYFGNVGGDGTCRGSFYNIYVSANAGATPNKKNGKTYLELDSFDIHVTIDDVNVYMSNYDFVSYEVANRYTGSRKRSSLRKLNSLIEEKGKKIIEKYIRKILSTNPVENFLYDGPRPQYTEENEI